MVKITEFLSHIYLFQSMSLEDLEVIGQFCALHEGKKGEMIFSQDQEANSFYIIIHGKMKIYKLFPQGEEQIIHLHGDGEVVAEAAIFNKIRYPGNGQLIKESLIVQIPKDPFIKMITERPQLAINMLSSYSRRLRQLITTIEYLSLKDSKHKVALYLLKNSIPQGNRYSCHLKHNKKEIAGLIGLTPESLSRVLTNFKKEGLIEEGPEGLEIVNREELMEILTNIKKEN